MGNTIQILKVCLYLNIYKLVKNEIETERDEFSRCPEHVDHMLQQPQTRYPPHKAGEESDSSRCWWEVQYPARILVLSFTPKHMKKLINDFCLHKRWQHGDIQLGKPMLRSSAWPKPVLLFDPRV